MTEKTISEMLGLDGGEFMDTVLTLEEWMSALNLERIGHCFVTQKRHEQKRRLHYVIALAVEGFRVREIDNFGSAHLEWGVEWVMEGQWDKVKDLIEWSDFRNVFYVKGFSEGEESEEHRRLREHYAELWSPFKELLQQAYLTREETPENATRH